MVRYFVSFPGLGIDWFNMNKTIPFFNTGKEIAWYGVIICIGIVLAVIYSLYRAKRDSIKSDDIIDLAFFLVMFGIIGARLFYVISEFDETFTGSLKDILYNIVSVWNGGLSILGALLAGFVTILVFCRIKKIKTFKMLDIVAPAVMIGQIVGRWGNFVNVEVYGIDTNLPWRMGVHRCVMTSQNADMHSLGLCEGIESFVHPLFLYESLWNLVGFVIANLLHRRKKFDGQVVSFYFMWYGVGRFIFEGMRDNQYILQQGPIRISQLIAFIMLLAGIALTVILCVRAKKHNEAVIDAFVVPVIDSEAEIAENVQDEETCEDEAVGDTMTESQNETENNTDGKDN